VSTRRIAPRTRARVGPRDDRAIAVAVVVAGAVLLAARPFATFGGSARTSVFLLAYALTAAAALCVGLEHPVGTVAETRVAGRAVTSWTYAAVIAAVGVGAVLVAGFTNGPVVPAPAAALALPASVLAAIAEEALFRRVAYARLARLGAVAAIVGSALLFALVHLPGYGTSALPVDLGAGLLFGWQRWASGTWTAPAATHAAANILASLR